MDAVRVHGEEVLEGEGPEVGEGDGVQALVEEEGARDLLASGLEGLGRQGLV